MDLFSRKIIEYAYSKSINIDLDVKSVKNACLNFRNIKGIILHSNLETQYKISKFENYLTPKGIIHSFSRKDNPHDNACIESFHSILNKEEANHHKYYNSNIARKAIFEYIESRYNRKKFMDL
ncbi:MAG: hypothetical protein ACTHW2_07995 [Tissierella sp.]|uniref:hypothetical protein n=1 Tax=Tissierella sp. TaxID=41274 RepID=UPI003F9BE8CF